MVGLGLISGAANGYSILSPPFPSSYRGGALIRFFLSCILILKIRGACGFLGKKVWDLNS